MFGQKIDEHLTMLQRVVALARDLILATVAILTSAIVYYGGNPTKLTAFDWARLIGAAFLIIVGPVIAFFIIKVAFNFLYGFLTVPLNIFLPGAPIPRGPLVWLYMRACRLSEAEYLREIAQFRSHITAFSGKHPRIGKVFISLLNALNSLYKTQIRMNPYIYAISVLIIAVYVFQRTIARYIP